MIKFCPDLTSKEEVVPITIGAGTFTRSVLHKCLQNKCVAYKLGKCLKYDNCTEYCLEKVDERKANQIVLKKEFLLNLNCIREANDD